MVIGPSVVVPILDAGCGIHQFHGGLITLCHGHFVLNANVPQGGDIILRSSDPTEPLAKGVVGVDHIPVTSGIWNEDGALGPVVVPLGDLNEGEHREQDTKKTCDHNAFTSCYRVLDLVIDSSGPIATGVFNALCT